jgi:hypothetical protein
MGSPVASIAGPVLGGIGGLIGGSKASQAANQQATAYRDAASWGRNAAAFQPFGMSTNFGSSNFQIDPSTGRVIGGGYSLNPQMQALQMGLFNQMANTNLNPDVSQFQTAANQAFGAGTNLFDLGRQYTSISPEQAQQQYMERTQAALAAGRERDKAAVANQVFRTGRTGIATGGTASGMLQSNPEYAALYNARAQQDLDISQRAQEQGRANQAFGANLYQQGAGLNQSGAGMLSGMQNYQTAAYNPLRAALGIASDIETLGSRPYDMSLRLGQQIADAGARQGEIYMGGERAAAPYSTSYNSYSPLGSLFQGAGSALSTMGGVGNMASMLGGSGGMGQIFGGGTQDLGQWFRNKMNFVPSGSNYSNESWA